MPFMSQALCLAYDMIKVKETLNEIEVSHIFTNSMSSDTVSKY